MTIDINELLRKFDSKDERFLGKIITLVEEETPLAKDILSYIGKKVGEAYRIGVTGPSGSGKSTVITKLTRKFLSEGILEIGIIACDPTSPFSHGALLGDRVRMVEIFTEKGVFIRSMATRGSLSGLAFRTKEVADVLDAFGKELIIIETIGVGQVEVEVANLVDTTILLLTPEGGDSIQVLKAGLMEIADIFVINKADRSGADALYFELRTAVEMAFKNNKWQPSIILTEAVNNQGVEKLYSAILQHKEFLKENNLLKEKRNKALLAELISNTEQKVIKHFWDNPNFRARFEKIRQDVLARKISVWEGVEELFKTQG